MDEHTATELAYKNGYDKGYADAKGELVRCKDCKWWKQKGLCPMPDYNGESYCSYGERKADENE